MEISILNEAVRIGLSNLLVLKVNGRKIYKNILCYIVEGNVSNIVISFDDILAADVTFLEGLLVNLASEISKKSNLTIILKNMNKSIENNLLALIFYYKKVHNVNMAFLKINEDCKMEIVGEIGKNLEDTFYYIREHESVTSRQIADHFLLEINTASNRLSRLAKLKLVYCFESGGINIYKMFSIN